MSEVSNEVSFDKTPPVLHYSWHPKRSGLKDRAAVYSVLLLMGAGGVLVLLPALNRASCACGKTTSAALMHQLVNAMMLYANEHQGALPVELDDLERQNYISKTRPALNLAYVYTG